MARQREGNLQEASCPTLDDDFAKDQGDLQNLAELRDRVRTDLLTHAKSEADARARAGLLDLVLDRNKIDVPESLVTREQRAMESDLASTLRQAGMPEEQVNERVQSAAEDIKTRAQKRAASSLVLDALAEQEKVEVTDDELAERIGAIMRQAGTKNRERFSGILCAGAESGRSSANDAAGESHGSIVDPRQKQQRTGGSSATT